MIESLTKWNQTSIQSEKKDCCKEVLPTFWHMVNYFCSWYVFAWVWDKLVGTTVEKVWQGKLKRSQNSCSLYKIWISHIHLTRKMSLQWERMPIISNRIVGGRLSFISIIHGWPSFYRNDWQVLATCQCVVCET